MMKVLIVDDEVFVRRGIARGVDWASVGCEVAAEAANGREGLDIARKIHPDLIVSDIRMPVMDGIEMLRTLREEGVEIPVIFLTAHSDFFYAQEALKLYAFDYLLKPFEDGELEEAVRKVQKRLNIIADERDEDEAKVLKSLDSDSMGQYVRETLKYIDRHYGDSDLGVGSVSEFLQISDGHLSHLFKNETGYSLKAFITRYRIRESMYLLRDCRKKIYEVAEEVGYKDMIYFSRTFKKMTGMTPSEYQNKKMREKKN